MSSFLERLHEKYKPEDGLKSHSSWIHKRTPEEARQRKFEQNIAESKSRQEMIDALTENIFYSVGKFLISTETEKIQQRKMENFAISWGKLIEKYGNDLVIALASRLGEIDFLNHEGYIKKDMLKELIKEAKKEGFSSL